MEGLNKNEKKVLIILFREPTKYYNSNTLGKKIGISRVGTMKILKKLEKNKILNSKNIGKSIIYRLNLDDDYVKSLISFLLTEEANNFKKWKDEFKGVFKEGRIIILFGSVVIDYSKANDISLMVIGAESSKDIIKKVNERQQFLSKRIHLITISPEEFKENLGKEQKTTIEILRTGIILYGQDKFVWLIKDGK